MKFSQYFALFRSKTDIFWICAVFTGLVLGFPNQFLDAPFLVVLWPAGCAVLGTRATSFRAALGAGWLASFAGAAAVLYWLYMPVHNVGNLPFPLAFACALFIAFVITSQSGLFSLFAWALKDLSPWRRAFSLGIIWYFLEYLYAALVGFPWLSPAGGLALWPVLLQTCDIVGAYATDGLWVCGALLIFFAILCRDTHSKIRWQSLCAGLLICLAIPAYGLYRLGGDSSASGEMVDALFVEGNVDQNIKWDPVFQRDTLNHYMALTRSGLEAAREKGVDKPLIIWPETAMPFFYQSRPELASIIRKFARETGCPLLFGAPGLEKIPGEDEPVVFNRAFLLGPSGKLLGYYDKEHLVPFGEYLPSWLNFGFLEALLQGVGIYHEGSQIAPIHYGPLALGMLICYEGIFPWLAQARVEDGANLLVDISNDGWFGTSPASRQHLYLTVPRCIEQGRWLMRATNTGISAVIDNRGRIVMSGPQFRAGTLLAKARLENSLSVYHKLAPWEPACALFLLMLIAWPVVVAKKVKNI